MSRCRVYGSVRKSHPSLTFGVALFRRGDQTFLTTGQAPRVSVSQWRMYCLCLRDTLYQVLAPRKIAGRVARTNALDAMCRGEI